MTYFFVSCFGFRHSVDVFDPYNQPGSGNIRSGSGALWFVQRTSDIKSMETWKLLAGEPEVAARSLEEMLRVSSDLR